MLCVSRSAQSGQHRPGSWPQLKLDQVSALPRALACATLILPVSPVSLSSFSLALISVAVAVGGPRVPQVPCPCVQSLPHDGPCLLLIVHTKCTSNTRTYIRAHAHTHTQPGHSHIHGAMEPRRPSSSSSSSLVLSPGLTFQAGPVVVHSLGGASRGVEEGGLLA